MASAPPRGPSFETGVSLTDRARQAIDKLRKSGGLAGLTAKGLSAASTAAGQAGEAYMENVAVPTAHAINVLGFGEPSSTSEDRRLQRQAAAKKVGANEAVSAAAAQPPPKPVGAAVGPETLMTENAGETTAAPPSTYYDRVKAVRMPNGKIVFTNVASELVKKGGEYQDYGKAVSEVSGRPWTGGTNVVEGPGGRAYVQPGQERNVSGVLARNAAPPPLANALPAINDPRAIMERRDWLAQQDAREAAGRQQAAGLAKTEAEAQQAVSSALIDPMERARLEAEARYGGESIKAEAEASRTQLAVKMLNKIGEEMNRVRSTMPPGPERDAALARLEEDRKLYLVAVRPEAASGLMRPDPYAAFGPPGAAPAAPIAK